MSPDLTVRVRVPATTANIGPGFDCLGAALSLHNEFEFRECFPASSDPHADAPPLTITVEGSEAEGVQCDRSNLAYRAFCHYFAKLQRPVPGLHLTIHLNIPLARGLGSSATAIVGGLVGANALAGSPLSQTALLNLAIELEGHPDNVAPALLGGCQLATIDEITQTWTLCPLQWSPTIVPVVAIPDFELSTEKARGVLPKQCSYPDAIFNSSHLGLLVKGLETGRGEWIRVALQDRLHQPYRTALISGFSEVYSAAMSSGAEGLVISGAGPTLLALSPVKCAESVAIQMKAAWQQMGISSRVAILSLETQGAIIA